MDTYTYLLERYPQAFVEAISTGASCNMYDHWESFPILDVTGRRIAMAATLYAALQSFENMQAITDWAAAEEARRRWDEAGQMLAVRHAFAATGDRKEYERAQAEQAAKRERRRDQPWRKGHA